MHQTRNMIAQNVALLTATSLVDPVSNLFGAKAVKDVAARQTKKGLRRRRLLPCWRSRQGIRGQHAEERGQTAFQIMAENGREWSIDNFVEAWDTDEAKHAGRIGGMMGLAIGAGTGIVQKRMEVAAAKSQVAQDAQIRAGAAALQEEVAAKQAQEQTATEQAMVAPETSVVAEIELVVCAHRNGGCRGHCSASRAHACSETRRACPWACSRL